VPAEAWNKKVAKRVLPPGTLRKAVRVVVPICAEEDRTAAAGDPSLAIWLGLLNAELEQLVSYEMAAEMAFPVFPDLPFAEALVAVANDHFSFVTAESEPGMKGTADGSAAAPVKQGRDKQSWRCSPAKAKSCAHCRSRLASGAGSRSSATSPTGRSFPASSRGPHATFEEEEDDFADLADASVSGGADPVSTAVMQMPKILRRMHQEKHKARDKSLEGILDYAESGSASSTTATASRSKAAALRSLQRMLTDKPQPIYAEIKKAMQQD